MAENVKNFAELVKGMDKAASLSNLVGGNIMMPGVYKIDGIELESIPNTGNTETGKNPQMIAGKQVAAPGEDRKAINIKSGAKALPLSALGQSAKTNVNGKPFAALTIEELQKWPGKFLAIVSRVRQMDEELQELPGQTRKRYAYKYDVHVVDSEPAGRALIQHVG